MAWAKPQTEDAESRIKTPYFRRFLVLILVVMVAGLMGDLFQGSLRQLPLLPPMLVVWPTVWFGLSRWGYNAVSVPFVFALNALFLLALWLQGYQNEFAFLFLATVLVILLLAGGLFLNKPRDIRILAVCHWIYFSAFVVQAFWDHRVTQTLQSLDQQLIAPVLFLVLGGGLVLLVRRVFSRIVGEYQALSDERRRGQESLGQLVRGLSHHLNTPLGNARVLLSVSNPDQTCLDADTVGLLQGSVNTSIRLIQRLDRFTTLCDHPSVTSADGPGLLSLFSSAKAEATWTTSPGFDRQFVTPREHRWEGLAFVLEELVDNAWVHGGTQPTVRLDAQGSQLHLEVESRGIAVEPGLVSRLRQPFFSTLVSVDHPGLGLYFADYLVHFVLSGRLDIDLGGSSATRVKLAIPLS